MWFEDLSDWFIGPFGWALFIALNSILILGLFAIAILVCWVRYEVPLVQFKRFITIRWVNVFWTWSLLHVTGLLWTILFWIIFNWIDPSNPGMILMGPVFAFIPAVITLFFLPRRLAFCYFLAGRKRIERFRSRT